MRSFRVVVEPPIGQPTEHAWEGMPLTFGRATDTDITCADSSMSRRHARLTLEGDLVLVEDLAARNGTYVNGQRIQGRRAIEPGDVIRMGATVVRVGGAGAATKAQPGAVLGLGELASSIFRPVADVAAADRLGLEPGGAAPPRVAARLKAINDFHRALAGAISLEALLELLLDGLFTALHPEEGVILLRQSDGPLRTAASRRLPGAQGELLVSQRLTEEVVERQTAALVTDVAADDRFAGAVSICVSGVRSILAAPLADGEGCLGMVAVYSRSSVRRFSEEDLDLLISLASAATLRIRNVELVEAAAARRVQDRELALAHDIQMAMLPRAMPDRREIEMSASLVPARAVGGDLYDFLVIGDSLWFIVADAAGKGVSAALFMAVSRTLFRAVAHRDASVASVVDRMNAELSRDNERQLFVTALVGRIDLATGTLTCCSAGHPPMLRRTGSGAVDEVALDQPGMALGILDDMRYAETRITLGPGDLLVAFTDGVTEAVAESGELFGEARLRQCLAESARQPAAAVTERIVSAVNTFAAGAPQEDDITVLTLRYAGR